MGSHLALRDEPFAQQQLDMAVVTRALQHRAAAQQIDAAVSDVRPIRHVVLNETHGARRTRLVIDRDSLAERDDPGMGMGQRQREEPLRIEHGMALLREAFAQRGHRHVRRLRPGGMAAHAVDDDEQHGAAEGEHLDSVLILLAVARQTELCMVEQHSGPLVSSVSIF
jgi:hypothetical protein